MIKIENIEVTGWEAAIRGMRNPMNSWDKSDSEFKYWCSCLGVGEEPHYCNECGYDICNPYASEPVFVVGANDLDLMKRLAKGGSVHAKYRRMIIVTCDITAPLYWWKEFDTYKVGTVANSCSTMHKIHDKEFTVDDFSHEHLDECSMEMLEIIVHNLNVSRNRFNGDVALCDGTTKKHHWWQMIQLLPSSYNQRRTVQFSYENGYSMHGDRRHHKLDEWHGFCDMLEGLPYAEGIIFNVERTKE